MTFQGDPYRTLGVAPGASLNEIRSAYRRLAKQFHPDFAGERALPRFLAVQAAYELLVDGEGRLRSPGGRGGAAEPWRAEPDRARASRDAWRARRAGRAGPPGGRAKADDAAAPGARGTGSGPGRGPSERRHGPRGPRRATPGSTTYDEATETPRNPAWDGGAWYGPSSGTYWTINPREYADPRKHGPDYLERARRPTDGRPTPRGPEAPAADSPGPEPAGPGAWDWPGAGPTTTGSGASWQSRPWRYEAPDGRPDPHRPDPHRPDPSPPLDAFLPDLEALVLAALPERLLARLRRSGPRWRAGLALLAWPPIGASLGGVVSALTGCDRFAASCPEPVPVLVLLLQPLLLAALIALPPVTAVGASAALAALAVAVPAGAVLAVGALPRPVVEPVVLGVIVGTAYAVALVAGAVRVWRAPAPGPSPRS